MTSIIAHCFTLSAFCTLYMGYFPISFVVDALESHPKTLLSIFIIINLFFLLLLLYIICILFLPT